MSDSVLVEGDEIDSFGAGTQIDGSGFLIGATRTYLLAEKVVDTVFEAFAVARRELELALGRIGEDLVSNLCFVETHVFM